MKDLKKKQKAEDVKVMRKEAKRLLKSEKGRDIFVIQEETESHNQTKNILKEHETLDFLVKTDLSDGEVFKT